jgi:hypothetical protein
MPKSLKEEMDKLAQFTVSESLKDESTMQQLFMLDADDKMIVCGLVVGPGPEIARTMRLLVLEHDPVMAIFQTEGWSVRAKPGETDPDRLAVMRGKKSPSQIPRHKRDEMLIMYGETPAGETLYRIWEILTVDGIRDLKEVVDPAMSIESRFFPLFLVDNMMGHMDRALAGLEPDLPKEMVEEFRRCAPPSRDEQRRVMRSLVTRMLVDGGGGTSRMWEQGRLKRRRIW